MRIVMMGTGPFAVPTFRALVEGPHEVVALFTQPPRGKPGEHSSPTRDAAEELGIEIVAEPDVNQSDALARLESYGADLLVVCDYGQILSSASLAAARLGGINLHGSYLPRYRGAAPIQWALYNGDSTTGVSVIHMTPRLDGGPCLIQLEETIAAKDDGLTLEGRLSQRGVAAVNEAIDMLAEWNGTDSLGVIQDNREATRAPRLKKTDGKIDWQRTANQIERQLRAFTPWPGSFTFVPRKKGDPQRLIVESASVLDETTELLPGTVVCAEEDRLHIAAGDGSILAIHTVQPAGKRAMGVDEYLRGRPVAALDMLL
jgi:methionyl-tRNA formyltransferase